MSKKNIKERGRFLKSLRDKAPADLRDELVALRREQFNLRMAAASGQPARPDQHAKVDGKIARVKTVLGELGRAKSAGSKA
jgi:large subunit ribosomal protein L29